MTTLQIANGKQHLNGRYPIDPGLTQEDQREYEPDLFGRYVIDHDHGLIIARIIRLIERGIPKRWLFLKHRRTVRVE